MTRSTLRILLIAATLASASAAMAADSDEKNPAVNAALQSVARVYCTWHGHTKPASGFVISRNGAKFIISAAHALTRGGIMSAKLYKQFAEVKCTVVAWDYGHDLMALRPEDSLRDIPSLPILFSTDPQPTLQDTVWMLGGDAGLEISCHRGSINADSTSPAEIARALFGIRYSDRHALRADTILVRHDADSTPGVSGGPLIDSHGRVFGIQIGTLPNTERVSFAVNATHLSDLDFAPAPTALQELQTADFADDKGPPLIERHAGRPVPIQIGEELVNAQCLRNDSIPNDPKKLLDDYVQDKEAYRKRPFVGDLDDFLKTTSLSQITNHVYGFNVLVPKNYFTDTIEFAGPPKGVFVAIRNPDPAVQSPFNTVKLFSFSATKFRDSAQDAVKAKLARGEYGIVTQAANPSIEREHFRLMVQLETADLLIRHFQEDVLQIRTIDADGRVTGKPEWALYRKEPVAEFASRSGVTWSCFDYVSKSGVGYAVQCGILKNCCTIVQGQFNKEDHENVRAGKPLSRSYLEQDFIRSTVGMY